MLPEIFIVAQYKYRGVCKKILVENNIIKTIEGKLPKDFGSANLTNLFIDQFVT